MKILVWIFSVITLILAIFFSIEFFLSSEWFVGSKEEQTRCAGISVEEAVIRAKEAMMAKPLGGVVRGETTSTDEIEVKSASKVSTGEIRISLERKDGSVVRAIVYEDCVVEWS